MLYSVVHWLLCITKKGIESIFYTNLSILGYIVNPINGNYNLDLFLCLIREKIQLKCFFSGAEITDKSVYLHKRDINIVINLESGIIILRPTHGDNYILWRNFVVNVMSCFYGMQCTRTSHLCFFCFHTQLILFSFCMHTNDAHMCF